MIMMIRTARGNVRLEMERYDQFGAVAAPREKWDFA